MSLVGVHFGQICMTPLKNDPFKLKNRKLSKFPWSCPYASQLSNSSDHVTDDEPETGSKGTYCFLEFITSGKACAFSEVILNSNTI